MWTGPPPYRPARRSWSPLWIVAAVFAGSFLGAYAASDRFSTFTKNLLSARQPHAPGQEPSELPLPNPSHNVNDASGFAHRDALVAPREVGPPPISDEMQPAAATRDVFLCKAYSGGMFWSSATCSTQRATIDRIVSVPGSFDWNQAVAFAEGRKQEAAALYAAPATSMTAGEIGRGKSASANAECASLKAQIEQLDAAARQPQSPQFQDLLRRQRQQARDREGELRC